MIVLLRKHIGTVITFIGFALLCIITFGDIGEIATKQYWLNVRDNLTAIGFLSVSLTMIQFSIKQGLSEQALQKGLNTEHATLIYELHRTVIARNNTRMLYLPYFLRVYNKRHTTFKRQEFLMKNNFENEKQLLQSKSKKLIRKYNSIRVYVIPSRIKWCSTEIVYNKQGQIQTLAEHRRNRALKGVMKGFISMVGMSLLAKGLFFDESGVSIGEKFAKLGMYILFIAMSSFVPVIREYEKGSLGIPNELEDINEIWYEFERWTIPEHVKNELQEVENEGTKASNSRTDIPAKSQEVQAIKDSNTNSILGTNRIDSSFLLSGDKK